MNQLNWGIVSTGEMAGNMATAFSHQSGSRIHAVCSRSAEKADLFGRRFAIPRRYSEFDEFLSDADLDVVYIASTQNAHFPQILAALKAGRSVLCEKPMTLNSRQAQACADEARGRGLFLMEAVWMRFFPLMERVRSFISEGGIGNPRLVSATFCLNIIDQSHRLHRRDLGGGALLDLGLYPLSLAQMILGPLQTAAGYAELNSDGVDVLDTMTVRAEAGGLADLACGLQGFRPRDAFVTGAEGSIFIHEIFFRPDRVTFGYGSRSPRTEIIPYSGNGYVHEILHVEECLRSGLTASPLIPPEDTVNVLSIMDELRSGWGVVYPEEE